MYGHQAASAALTGHAFTADHPIRSSRLTFGPTVLDSSGQDHERLRSVLGSELRPSKVAGYASDVVVPIIEESLDHLPRSGAFDLVEHLALPIPMRVICRLLGIDRRHALPLCRRIAPLVEVIDHGNVSLTTARTAHDGIAALVRGELFDRASVLSAAPIGEALIAAVDGGILNLDAAIDNVVLLLVAGTVTASAALANAAAYFLAADAPERGRRALDAERGAFTREFLRLQPSVRYTPRFATTSTTLGGVGIDQGEVLLVCLASANRDPLVYRDPAEWTTDRGSEPAPLSFGRGLHSCLGNLLGELELTATMRRAVPVLDGLVMTDGSSTLVPGWTLRRRASLVVEQRTTATSRHVPRPLERSPAERTGHGVH